MFMYNFYINSADVRLYPTLHLRYVVVVTPETTTTHIPHRILPAGDETTVWCRDSPMTQQVIVLLRDRSLITGSVCVCPGCVCVWGGGGVHILYTQVFM